jgi:hypothetical protein
MFRSTNRQGTTMKRLTCVGAIVLGLVVAITTAPVSAIHSDGDEHSVTAAVTGAFDAGAIFGPVALEGIEVGTGVLIEADGSASGTFHAVLQGNALGSAREITVEGKVSAGSMGPDGRATFSGTASIDLGDGTPPLPGVVFSVIAGTDGVALTIDSTVLPAAALTDGAITIE